MKTYIVLYRDNDADPISEPLGFRCQADDPDHAKEQCENAYPGCDVVWVWLCAPRSTDDLGDALVDYYDTLAEGD